MGEGADRARRWIIGSTRSTSHCSADSWYLGSLSMANLLRKLQLLTSCAAAGLGMLASLVPAAAQDVAAFYRGRTIEVYAGSEPGSGYDGYARIVARNIGRHIPGTPNVIVKNMPAASGLAEANFLYNQAPRDGS